MNLLFNWFCKRTIFVLAKTKNILFWAFLFRQWRMTCSLTSLFWNSSSATFSDIFDILDFPNVFLSLRLLFWSGVFLAISLRRSAITVKRRISCHKLAWRQARYALLLLCFEYVYRFQMHLANIESLRFELKEWLLWSRLLEKGGFLPYLVELHLLCQIF